MNLFKQPRPTAKAEHLQQIKAWTQELLDLPAEVPISISQLQCHEPGCPPMETVIAVMSQPPQTFKIHAAAGDVTLADLQGAIAPQGLESNIGSLQ
ncbi:hypothetical protein IQ254_22240 [Nodosilinea sp. LEGE 07088]|uniref:hypothetical protein n=1 Tax=Nodosilinea sp. LEGE 07088 TaxID=2777968 RepID=UPI0018803ED6|nr:hypothetical protein [Nodosilinea sp. LEGE 07088]MBE9139881.1 hypothetical protein [Nodosilinea sp. LEGE 07088]